MRTSGKLVFSTKGKQFFWSLAVDVRRFMASWAMWRSASLRSGGSSMRTVSRLLGCMMLW